MANVYMCMAKCKRHKSYQSGIGQTSVRVQFPEHYAEAPDVGFVGEDLKFKTHSHFLVNSSCTVGEVALRGHFPYAFWIGSRKLNR